MAPIRIEKVEAIPINPPLAARNAGQKPRFAGIDTQTVFRLRCDNGVVGYGDTRGHSSLSAAEIDNLVGRSPFDFVNANLNNGLMGALYDAMGKHLEVPAYQLMGQKLRDRVAVAAWTRPASPEELAAEVQRAAAEGYLRFKIHTCEYYDVLEQNHAVEQVAPPGFLMHYDFNHNRPLMDVLGLVHQLEKSPVVGLLEDPLVWNDLEGWRRLRDKTSLPLLMHVPQLGGGPEILNGCADAYMVGETGLGTSIARAHACAAANLSTVIQLTGGTLSKAFALHLGAVLPNVAYSTNLDDQYDDDVTGGRIAIEAGSSPVPTGPGLGVEVDEERLQRLAAIEPTQVPRFIGVTHLPGNHKLYTRSFPALAQQSGFAEGNIRGVRLDVWEEDNSDAFKDMWERTAGDAVWQS
jgi:L-alanine-DL-glutamate epimerase-like enolase superfamily enzyme